MTTTKITVQKEIKAESKTLFGRLFDSVSGTDFTLEASNMLIQSLANQITDYAKQRGREVDLYVSEANGRVLLVNLNSRDGFIKGEIRYSRPNVDPAEVRTYLEINMQKPEEREEADHLSGLVRGMVY